MLPQWNRKLYERYHKYAWVTYVVALVMGVLSSPWWLVLIPFVLAMLIFDWEVPVKAVGKPGQIFAGYALLFLMLGGLMYGAWGLGLLAHLWLR